MQRDGLTKKSYIRVRKDEKWANKIQKWKWGSKVEIIIARNWNRLVKKLNLNWLSPCSNS